MIKSYKMNIVTVAQRILQHYFCIRQITIPVTQLLQQVQRKGKLRWLLSNAEMLEVFRLWRERMIEIPAFISSRSCCVHYHSS